VVYVITPIAECIDVQQDGSVIAKFGYQNDAQVDTFISIGEFNRFAPGLEDRGQPESFLKGRVTNSFTVTFPSTDQLEWFLGNASVTVDLSTTRCGGSGIDCVQTDNTKPLMGLDNTAARQDANVRALTRRGRALRLSASLIRELEQLRQESRDLYLTQWSGIWGSFTKITNTCTGCQTIEKAPDIAAIVARSRQFRRLSRRAFDIISRAQGRRPVRSDVDLYQRAEVLHSETENLAASLPRFESLCP
jgi:hypothetical protein